MSAPESVVNAVMKALGCRFIDARSQRSVTTDGFEVRGRPGCREHRDRYGMMQWSERGCPFAVTVADAAFPASLEWAADNIDLELAYRINEEGEAREAESAAEAWLRTAEARGESDA